MKKIPLEEHIPIGQLGVAEGQKHYDIGEWKFKWLIDERTLSLLFG